MTDSRPDTTQNPFLARFRKGDFYKFFLVVAMPVHFWAIFMALEDLEYMVGRSFFWDFLGYAGYVLIIAFIESLLLSGVFLLAGLLLPKGWRKGINLSVLSSWALAVLLAGIANQYYFFLDVGAKDANPYLVRAFDYVHYYEKPLFFVVMLMVLLSAILPPLLLPRLPKLNRLMLDVVDRLGLLSTLFLVLDTIGLLIVIYRNLSKLVLL